MNISLLVQEANALKDRIRELADEIDMTDVRDTEFVNMSKQIGSMRQYLMYLQMRIADGAAVAGK